MLFIAVTPFLFLPSGGVSPLHERIELVDGDAHEAWGQKDIVASRPIDDDPSGFKSLDHLRDLGHEDVAVCNLSREPVCADGNQDVFGAGQEGFPGSRGVGDADVGDDLQPAFAKIASDG